MLETEAHQLLRAYSLCFVRINKSKCHFKRTLHPRSKPLLMEMFIKAADYRHDVVGNKVHGWP